jgi:hypothetical protein
VCSWQRPNEIHPEAKLFIGGADDSDVMQGALGDCWFLAALCGTFPNIWRFSVRFGSIRDWLAFIRHRTPPLQWWPGVPTCCSSSSCRATPNTACTSQYTLCFFRSSHYSLELHFASYQIRFWKESQWVVRSS